MYNLAVLLIVLSAIPKAIALRILAKQQGDPALRQKRYTWWNIFSYLLLLPGAMLLIYVYFT